MAGAHNGTYVPVYWLHGISVLKKRENDSSPYFFSVLFQYQAGGDKSFCMAIYSPVLNRIPCAGYLDYPFQNKRFGSSSLAHFSYLPRLIFSKTLVFLSGDPRSQDRVWARDLWHLRNRLLRMVFMHTLCVLFNLQDHAPPLQLERLVAQKTCTSG